MPKFGGSPVNDKYKKALKEIRALSLDFNEYLVEHCANIDVPKWVVDEFLDVLGDKLKVIK